METWQNLFKIQAKLLKGTVFGRCNHTLVALSFISHFIWLFKDRKYKKLIENSNGTTNYLKTGHFTVSSNCVEYIFFFKMKGFKIITITQLLSSNRICKRI